MKIRMSPNILLCPVHFHIPPHTVLEWNGLPPEGENPSISAQTELAWQKQQNLMERLHGLDSGDRRVSVLMAVQVEGDLGS